MEQETPYLYLQHTHRGGGGLLFYYIDGLVVVLLKDTSNLVLCDIVDIIIIFWDKNFAAEIGDFSIKSVLYLLIFLFLSISCRVRISSKKLEISASSLIIFNVSWSFVIKQWPPRYPCISSFHLPRFFDLVWPMAPIIFPINYCLGSLASITSCCYPFFDDTAKYSLTLWPSPLWFFWQWTIMCWKNSGLFWIRYLINWNIYSLLWILDVTSRAWFTSSVSYFASITSTLVEKPLSRWSG